MTEETILNTTPQQTTYTPNALYLGAWIALITLLVGATIILIREVRKK